MAEHDLTREECRALADQPFLGVFRTSMDGRILFANQALARMFGCEGPEELIGRTSFKLYDDPADRRRIIGELTERGQMEGVELRGTTKQGGKIDMLLSAVRRGDEIIGTVLDISGRKQLEAQLRHAQKMDALGQLAGGMAHDFSNILSAIMGYGQLLRMKLKSGDPARQDAERIMTCAERAAALTQTLLAFSRKQAARPEPCDLNEVLRPAAALAQHVAGPEIDVRTVLRDQRLPVFADRGQVEQVIVNLALNARDAMPDGGSLTLASRRVAIDDGFVRAHGYGAPGDYALLTMTDTGKGIPAEEQAKIFEPFFTTKPNSGGAGLGLAIVYGIVKDHKGFVNVYSEEGKGTTFKVYLPLLATADRPEHPAPKAGRETILLVEDDHTFRRLTATILGDFGYSAVMAQDGEEAVRLLTEAKGKINLALLDFMLPKKNGLEAYAEMKAIDPALKVIFMSGYARESEQVRSKLPPDMPFLMKPLLPRDLLAKIRQLLDGA